MNPSPQAVAWIRGNVQDWTQADPAILAFLRSLTVSNPVGSAPQVPAPFTESSILAKLDATPTTGSQAKLLAWPNYSIMRAEIAAQNRANIAAWAPRLISLGLITAAERTSIGTLLTATTADPNWAPNLPADVATLGRAIDLADIAASRPGSN